MGTYCRIASHSQSTTRSGNQERPVDRLPAAVARPPLLPPTSLPPLCRHLFSATLSTKSPLPPTSTPAHCAAGHGSRNGLHFEGDNGRSHFFGMEELRLQGGVWDASLMRERLARGLFREAGVAADVIQKLKAMEVYARPWSRSRQFLVRFFHLSIMTHRSSCCRCY